MMETFQQRAAVLYSGFEAVGKVHIKLVSPYLECQLLLTSYPEFSRERSELSFAVRGSAGL